ncbi:type IV secretory system conjugative DNA transfer family protein, partial [Flavobacterium sp.]|uniref:type IV secretory system conjugative DNA transfer family protein n=1 Tax=Flavobacterium sp. TaxID=239 RepID=UPI00260B5D63
ASLVLLDPHGDISEKLFSLNLNIENPSRLWYIDPSWDVEKIPCLNPFWNKVKDPVLVDLLSQQWAKAFSELIPEAGMSLQMEAVLKPCLSVMFQNGKCGLLDLQLFMDDAQNEKWVELGKHSSHPVFRTFFESAFLNKKYAPTKLAIYTRLQLLLNNYAFYQMMNGKSSIDLKKGMAQGKVILFNLSKGKLGEDTSKALGRFISATLLSIALQRAFEKEGNRKSCYLFVDEFHNMASSSMETVFSEARKYHLHLIVGTQTIGQLPLSLKEMVLNNTAVKLVGLNGLPALKSQAVDIGVSFADLQSLPPFHFYLKYDHHPALKIKSADFMLKNPKRYFALEKQTAFLKEFVLQKSGIYRASVLEFSTPNSAGKSKKITPEVHPLSDENFTPEFDL